MAVREETVSLNLGRLRESLAAHRLVNLVGPLGAGKSRLLAELDACVSVDLTTPGGPARLRAALAGPARLVAVDGIDGAGTLAQAQRILTEVWCPDAGQVVLASRTAVAGRCEWDGVAPAVVGMAPWLDEDIDALVERRGLSGPDERRFVVRMSGGNPLIATSLTAAVHLGAPINRSAAVADHAADVIVGRLGAERCGADWRRVLRVLAGVGFGDEELLDVDEDDFAAVAELSIVARAGLGLTVVEPYRTILDLSYRWRRPLEHRTTLTRAGVHRIRMLSETSDHELRKDLTVHGIFLADEPYVRAMLFPPRPALPPITVAGDDDSEDIGRMMRVWALDSDLDVRATDRMADRWLAGPAEHFHLARGADGRGVALAHLVPFDAAGAGGVELVAQQFTERFVEADEGRGTFVITGFWPDETTGAAMLRHILEEGIDRGRIVVCTPKPEYQRLCRGMGLPHYGTTRYDTFGAGHSTHVFSQRTTPADLPRWMSRLAAFTGRSRPPDYLAEQLVQALESIRTPARLARSPLLAAPHAATVADLREWLTRAVETLARSDRPKDAEAGRILRRYYLGGAADHARVATRLRLSRAAYSRGLSHGLAVLTDWFRAAGTELLGLEPDDSAVSPADTAPSPTDAGTLDEFTARLRALRAWAGDPSYAEITRRIGELRAARRLPGTECRPARITVYDCFRAGRHRLDVELVVDIVRALGGDEDDVRRWRGRYGALTGNAPAS